MEVPETDQCLSYHVELMFCIQMLQALHKIFFHPDKHVTLLGSREDRGQDAPNVSPGVNHHHNKQVLNTDLLNQLGFIEFYKIFLLFRYFESIPSH